MIYTDCLCPGCYFVEAVSAKRQKEELEHADRIPDIELPDPEYFSATLRQAFSPVRQYKLFWEDEDSLKMEDAIGRHYECEDRYAVVREDSKFVFTTVTKGYYLILHKDAYELEERIAIKIFGNSNEKLIPRVDLLTANGAACEISLRREIEVNQPEILNGWHAVVKMGNSYNKTKQLSYIIGFEFGEEGGSILLPDFAIKVKDPHQRPLHDIEIEIMHLLAKTPAGSHIKHLEEVFVRLIGTLKDFPMSMENLLRLFCKTYGEKDLQRAKQDLDYIYNLILEYSKTERKSAYTMLLVFGKYVRDRYSRQFGRDMMSDQLMLGRWATNFVDEISNSNFSLHNYFGAEICDLVSEFMSYK